MNQRLHLSSGFGMLVALICGACAMTLMAQVPLSHERSYPGSPKPTPQEQALIKSFRDLITSARFKRFQFTGTFGGAISHFMMESLKVTADGRSIGGFVAKNSAPIDKSITVDIRDKNALEVINELCRAADATWTLAPYAIFVEGMEK